MEFNGVPASAIVEIARRHGARTVKVFGSHARGEAGPKSDLDLLVSVERGTTLFDLIHIQIELEQLLGIPVDVVTEPSLRPELRERVLKEARVLAA